MREQATFALAQMTVAEQPELNLKKMEEQMREARERFRAELILFPETCMAEFSRGMTREDRYALAETRDGNFVRAVRELAARHSIWTVFGFYERAETQDSENRSYNSSFWTTGEKFADTIERPISMMPSAIGSRMTTCGGTACLRRLRHRSASWGSLSATNCGFPRSPERNGRRAPRFYSCPPLG